MKTKTLVLMAACALGTSLCSAQVKTDVKTKKQNVEYSPGKTVVKKVYEMKDEGVVLPQYPGGLNALMKFLSTNIKYPAMAERDGIEGKVLCCFVISEDGTMMNPEIERSVDPLLDNEALRVVNLMPKWKPGTKDGFPISVRYILPVSFRLNKSDVNKSNKSADQGKTTREELEKEGHTLPSFPGGGKALMAYLSTNIKYPSEALRKNIGGRVICNFVVEKDGSVSDVNVVQSVSADLDAEAVRVIKSMPKWNPGRKGDEFVRVKYTLPVTFNPGPKEESNGYIRLHE